MTRDASHPAPPQETDTPPSAVPVRRPTTTVAADRFDLATWHDTRAQSTALRDLAAELSARHEGATDLITDVFLAAYQARPRLRDRATVDPARLVNHHILTSLMEPPEFAELRRTTAGDAYAAAMSVLAMSTMLRRIVEHADEAEQASRAQLKAERVAAQLAEAVRQSDGEADYTDQALREAAETARTASVQAMNSATQALTAAVPGMRAAAHAAAAQAATAARREAELLRAWGVGSAQTERLPFAERLRLAERLATSRLARWADLIGRFRQMASGERARKVEHTSGELVGVTLGDDLSRIVPSELAHLGLPPLRAVFAARFAAGELMLYDSRGEHSFGRGAIIACVDTSHSMYEEGPGGVTREAWAKACALALLDQARHARRDFVGILFSAADKLQVFRFPADEPAPVERVLEFAETFLGGGTDYQRPLGAAAELLQQEFDDAARSRGDIVMITDDDCGVTEEWMRQWKETKRRLGFRVFGAAVGVPPAAAVESVLDVLCDNLRSIEDLTDVHAAADLFRVI
ncbi:VWA domain-containing protein [Streptomyces nigra]|uniref:VWA domain-containing protein n=1 Tax=Streptomyces nigra TaxID=1827580 RepID=UPI0036BF7E34